MKILVLADEESRSLYEHYDPEKLKGIGLIIACGDLRRNYLDFFASMTNAPVIFVLGNHDGWYNPEDSSGCICIEDDIFVYHGIRILGLGGSMRYHPGAQNQYTEREMRRRIRRLRWKLFRSGGFDILVAHSPARHVNDLEDRPHQGFECFCSLMDKYRPKFFIHGHVHAAYGGFRRLSHYGDTVVVNAYEHYVIEYPDMTAETVKKSRGISLIKLFCR